MTVNYRETFRLVLYENIARNTPKAARRAFQSNFRRHLLPSSKFLSYLRKRLNLSFYAEYCS